jgi:signal transduction histidine kinase
VFASAGSAVWRSPDRQAPRTALALVTLALCLVSTGTVRGAGELVRSLPAGTVPPAIQAPASLAAHLIAVAVVAPLPLAFWRPMLAWRTGWVLLLFAPAVPATWWGGWPWSPAQVIALLAAFCLAGIRQQRTELWLMWALTLIPWSWWLISDVPNLGGPAGATIVFAAVAVTVDSVGSRLRAQRALAAQTERADAERARRALLEERSRIARELHDVVAHHMSLLAIRAESAPYRITDLPDQARAEFGSLSEGARHALADMRRLLGVLRSDQPPALTLAPQPRLADLPALVGAASAAGVSVQLTLPAALDRIPAGVGVCAYRIVQESLSNAAQHAPGSEVTVSVREEAGAVLLRVANGPGVTAGQPGQPGQGSADGHGLSGMRERVALLGGSLSAGPAPDGGFVVSAALPAGEPA